jgi:UDPglucose 6-dehydrogenase
MLRDSGALIHAFDPTALGGYSAYPWISVADDPLTACAGADVLAVLTEWPMFADIDPSSLKAVMKSPRVVDGRNLLDLDSWKSAGFEYVGIGR